MSLSFKRSTGSAVGNVFANQYVMSAKIQYYLLTPWSRVLLEKLTGSAANQEIPIKYV